MTFTLSTAERRDGEDALISRLCVSPYLWAFVTARLKGSRLGDPKSETGNGQAPILGPARPMDLAHNRTTLFDGNPSLLKMKRKARVVRLAAAVVIMTAGTSAALAREIHVARTGTDARAGSQRSPDPRSPGRNPEIAPPTRSSILQYY